MFGKVFCGLAVAGLLIACGPAASLNNNEGGSCSAQNDNCGGELDCQPIQGRTGGLLLPDAAGVEQRTPTASPAS